MDEEGRSNGYDGYNVSGKGRFIAEIDGPVSKCDLGDGVDGGHLNDGRYALRDVLSYARLGLKGLQVVRGDAYLNSYDREVARRKGVKWSGRESSDVVSMTATNMAVCDYCGQKVRTKVLPGRGGRPSYDSHKDRNGEMCKGAGWKVPEHTEPKEFIPTDNYRRHTAARKVHLEPKGLEGIEKCSECGKPTRYWLKGNQVPLCPECAKKDGKKTAGVETCRFGEIPLGGKFKFKGHVWERRHGMESA
jgi:DNA-directed RNA polymerase subunit RPC12/RpoP